MLQSDIELYRVIHTYTGLYTAIQSYTGLHRAIHIYTKLCIAIHGDTVLYTSIQGYTQLFMAVHSFTFRIVNFPHMDSNIPANPAYGVYISQLVRYARICTSKVDFMNRLRGLSLHLRQQGFLTNLLQRTFTKFFNRHDLIVVKYGATLREMRFAIQAWIAPSYPYITYLFIT